MACNPVVLNGLALSCGANAGGINTIYVTDIQNISGITFTGSTVSGITMVTGKKWAKYDLRKNLSTFEETYNNDDTGAKYVSTTTTAIFTKQDSALRDELELLFSAQVYVIVVDNNGKYKLVGYSKNTPTYCWSNATATTGASRSDSNQISLTIASEQDELSFYLDSASILSTIV